MMQRLDRIKQLGNTHLVYPSACHTRLEHSIGVLHIANRMAEKLEVNDRDREIIRYAALLHDIGHGPLSHNFERIFQIANNNKEITHEDITLKIIREDPEIKEILGKKSKKVLSLFDKDNLTVNSEIISSNVDADKLDYLRRDSHHAGVAYGLFDLERILHTIRKKVDDKKSYIAVHEKGLYALEDYRLARYLMYTQVYYHHVRTITDGMFRRALEIAFRDGIIEKKFLNIKNPKFLANYNSLDDNKIFSKILSSRKNNARILIDGLEKRHLLKRGYEIEVAEVEKPLLRVRIMQMEDKLEELEGTLAKKCGCDPDFIIANLLSIENVLYKSTYELAKEHKTPILIEFEGGKEKAIDEVSKIFPEKTPLIKLSVSCPREHRDKVSKMAERKISDLLGFSFR